MKQIIWLIVGLMFITSVQALDCSDYTYDNLLVQKGTPKTLTLGPLDYTLSFEGMFDGGNTADFEMNGIAYSIGVGDRMLVTSGVDMNVALTSVTPTNAKFCIKLISYDKVACEDSDGRSFTTKGVVEYTQMSGRVTTHQDTCFAMRPCEGGECQTEVASCSGDNCQVHDTYCTEIDGKPAPSADYKDCPEGCRDGVCGSDSPRTLPHYLVVHDNSLAKDIILVKDLGRDLEDKLGDFEIKLNKDVYVKDLEDRVTLFVYQYNALIIVGSKSPAEHVKLSIDMAKWLKEEHNIQAQTKLSTEVKYDDLRKVLDSRTVPVDPINTIDARTHGDMNAPIKLEVWGGFQEKFIRKWLENTYPDIADYLTEGLLPSFIP